MRVLVGGLLPAGPEGAEREFGAAEAFHARLGVAAPKVQARRRGARELLQAPGPKAPDDLNNLAQALREGPAPPG